MIEADETVENAVRVSPDYLGSELLPLQNHRRSK